MASVKDGECTSGIMAPIKLGSLRMEISMVLDSKKIQLV